MHPLNDEEIIKRAKGQLFEEPRSEFVQQLEQKLLTKANNIHKTNRFIQLFKRTLAISLPLIACYFIITSGLLEQVFQSIHVDDKRRYSAVSDQVGVPQILSIYVYDNQIISELQQDQLNHVNTSQPLFIQTSVQVDQVEFIFQEDKVNHQNILKVFHGTYIGDNLWEINLPETLTTGTGYFSIYNQDGIGTRSSNYWLDFSDA